jgi:Tfp pilus assembly protein PilO
VDRNRIKMIIAALSGVAVLALGFFLGVQPQLTAAATAADQRVSVEAQNEGLRATLAQLVAENDQLSTLTTDRDTRRASVPAAADMPGFIRQLDEMASEAGVPVTSFTTADAASYEVPATTAVPSTDAPADAAAPAEGEDEAAAAPVVPAAPTAPTTYTDPTITAANFSTIAVTVDIQGSYDQALDFVDRLQKGPRLFLVTAITSSEAEEGADGEAAAPGAQTWTVGGLVFVMQDGETAPADGDATTTAPTQAEGADAGADATAAGR